MSKYLVFGHQNPDTDAISSAIIFAYYLNQQGHEAEAVALGEPNGETAYALKQFDFQAPRVVESVAQETDRVALVDHNEPQQSVADIDQVRVDYVVDHHRIAGFETAEPLYYRCEPIGCTASVLYKMYKENDVEIPADIAGLMASAIISDSLLLQSPTTTDQDRQILAEVAAIAGIDYESYGMEMLKAGADHSSKTAAELVNGDAKNFVMAGKELRIGQINVVGFDEMRDRKGELLEAMEAEVAAGNYDVFLVVVTDIVTNNSLGFVVGDNTQVVEEAFQAPVADQEINLPGVMSRKKQVVPALEKAYDA